MNQAVKRPREIFKAHPIFGWVLTPHAQVNVPFRTDVLQNINEYGQRTVPPPPAEPRATLVTYGCSYTYGTGLKDDETYPALLQAALPDIRVENKGVGGHSSVQNLMRFRNDIMSNRVDMAVFGIISDHKYRNIPHPRRMKAHLSPDWYKIGVEHVPHVHLDRDGNAFIKYTAIWQPSLFRNDFEVFLPDEHYLDVTTLAVFGEIASLAAEHDIPVLFALLDQLDPQFNKLMLSHYDQVVDVSTPYNRTFNFLPDDPHPNEQANRLFAERLLPHISQRLLQT